MYKYNNLRKILKISFSIAIVLLLLISFALPFFANAEAVGTGGGGNPAGGTGGGGNPAGGTGGASSGLKLINPLKWDNLIDFWREVLKIAAQIGSIFVVVGFVYTGFLFVKSRGNAEELQVAKRSFTYTVIGAALVLGAWAFAMAISETVKSLTN